MILVLVLVIVAGGAATLFGGDGDDTKDASTTSTTGTSLPETESAQGKPCVAQTGEPPPGAPGVPVKEGQPPEELVAEDLEEGDGPEVPEGATVTVNYIGVACSTGAVFDDSYSRGEPATFPLSGVIVGWQKGIPGMKAGGRRLLGIPSDQAYGPAGSPPTIAPDETLWFVVELISFEPGQPAG